MQRLEFCDCKNIRNFMCDMCALAKNHHLPFGISKNMAKNVFELIHVNLWGPYRVSNINEEKYFFFLQWLMISAGQLGHICWLIKKM